jgi:hypothetical protein
LAKYQQLQTLSKVSNLSDLAVVRVFAASHPTLSFAQMANMVAGILSSANASGLLNVNLPDLTVYEGGTLVLAGPINQLTANNVQIDGTIIVHGSLNLICNQLGGTNFASLPGQGGGGPIPNSPGGSKPAPPGRIISPVAPNKG